MKLEDFFTLAEMKDGLTALARVEELVSIMQKEKDSVLKNVREAARQWSTVARTLAATESEDCLDLFVQLDGLRFLDHWLQEVHKCSDEISDSFAEESITSLLAALEKLPKDKERFISSAINMTVKDLVVHKSRRVQDRARALFDSLNQVRDEDVDHRDIEKGGACMEDEVTASAKGNAESGCPEQSDAGVYPLIGIAEEDKSLIEPSGGEFQHSQSSDGFHSRIVEDAKLHMSTNQHNSLLPLNQANQDEFQGYALEGQSTAEESSLHPAEKTASTGTFSSPALLKGNAEGKSSDIVGLKASSEDAKETDGVKGSQDKSGREEIDNISTSSEPKCISSTANHPQSVMEPDAEETLASQVNGVSVDDGLLKHSGSTEDFMNTDQGDECLSNDLQDLPSDKHNLSRAESLDTSFCRVEDVGAVSNVKDLTGESSSKVCRRGKLAIPGDVLKLNRDAKASGKIEKRKSEMELEYGVDDALEVARQVAKEVEREVVDNREPFCSSSSDKNSEDGVVRPGSPDSINDEKDQLMTNSLHDVPTGQNLSCGASSLKEENLMNSRDADLKPENCMQDLESSQVTEAALEPADNSERGLCDFDLNEEVCSEEMASPPTHNSAPIAVSTTKAAAATAIPAAPLHFEGALGWKGSAPNSAFRPPAPRKTPDGEKTQSVEGSSHSSRYRQEFLDIDLNVAGADDGVTDPALAKQIPESSSLPSGESSVEVSSRRAERLKLDLNRSGDNEDAPLSNSRTEGQYLYHHRNGHRSPSPASSSSSRQPLVRNIDLNDSPYFFDDTYDQRKLGKSPCQDMNAHGGFKVDDHFISIMGKRVGVNLKDCAPQTHSFIPNGQVGESLMETGMARSGGGVVVASPAIAHTASSSRLFGYSGLTAGPSMSVTPAVYGPTNIPYMVDSRGAPVLLQIMGSAAADPPSYSQGSFFPSMPSGLNGVGPSQSGFDLNSGVMMLEGSESREAAVGLRQLFVQGQGGSVGEQMRTATLPLNLGVGVRRKEPEGGWESYPVGYKRQAPWN